MKANPAANTPKPPTPQRLRNKIKIDEYNLPILPKGLIIHGHRSYRIGELLGEGGTAAVYEAFDLESRKKVALKTSIATKVNDSAAEVFTNIKLPKHPNLGQLIDIGNIWLNGHQRPDLNFMVFEHIGIWTLGDKLQAEGPLSPLSALRVLDQICDGLLAAYQAGIKVHRDLKPDNIVLRGETDIPVIIDFAFSRPIFSRQY